MKRMVENKLINQMKDAISGNNEVVISITDDDWDDVNAMYVKHVDVNNAYVSFNFTGTHPFSLELYCPHFKGLATGYGHSSIDGVGVLTNDPKDRYISIISENVNLAVFNGIVTTLEVER